MRSATCAGEQNIIFLSSDNATFCRSELEVKGTEEYQRRGGLPSSFNGLGEKIDLWQAMTEKKDFQKFDASFHPGLGPPRQEGGLLPPQDLHGPFEQLLKIGG